MILLFFSSVGKDVVELSAPLFRYSAMAGDTDGMYSYGKLLETGQQSTTAALLFHSICVCNFVTLIHSTSNYQ